MPIIVVRMLLVSHDFDAIDSPIKWQANHRMRGLNLNMKRVQIFPSEYLFPKSTCYLGFFHINLSSDYSMQNKIAFDFEARGKEEQP